MLQIDHLTTADAKVTLDDVSFVFEAGKIYTILGRTGAGKTELLRALMGLNPLTVGTVKLDEEDITERPIRARNMSLVYQQFINYPHLSVLDNVAFPLRRQGKDKAEAHALAGQMLTTVGLGEFLQRRPAQLSGGQQQRVALARAMVKQSRILMLDEPLANLDYKLREQLREEFPRLVADNVESVILYTTTEPRECMELGNTMIVMHDGRVIASGAPADLFAHPPTKDTASVISDPPIWYPRTHWKPMVVSQTTLVEPPENCDPRMPITTAVSACARYDPSRTPNSTSPKMLVKKAMIRVTPGPLV